jgi:sodium pump decarboxylase gamma subunit
MIPQMIGFTLALAERPTLGENFRFQLVGLVIVLGVLGLLAVLIKLVGAFMVSMEGKAQKASVRSATGGPGNAGSAAPAQSDSSASVPPEIFAAIAAAVDTLLDEPFGILSVREEVQPPPFDYKLMAWSVEGRRQIFTSHKLR